MANTVLADYDYPLIKTDLKSLKERRAKEFNILRAVSSSDYHSSSAGKVNLLPLVSTKGEMRDQKKCGNCWVWTGLAALEIAKNGYDGSTGALSSNSFSVGFVNSFYNDGGRSGAFACNGGFFSDLARFFSQGGEAKQRVIPWSNNNADFVDADGGKTYKGSLISNRTKEQIEITPYYYLSNLLMQSLPVDYMSDDEVINAIKYVLDQGTPVALGFYMTGSHDWYDFKKFWAEGSKNEIFDIGSRTSQYNSNYMAGHAALIVGYDDTDANPDNHHWIALNSWGTPSGHPDGTFKLKMHTNYKSYISDLSGNAEFKMEWYKYEPVFTSQEPYIDRGSLSGKFVDPLGAGVKDIAVKLNDNDVILSDKNGMFSFSNVPAYKDFKLSFSRPGYKFTPEIYTGTMTKATNYIEVKVENNKDYISCKGAEINLNGVGSKANAIFNMAKIAAKKLKNSSDTLKKLNSIQKGYLNAFNAYPRIRYTCTPACKQSDFSSNKAKLRSAINSLANTAKANWQKCLKQNKVKAKVVATKKKAILLKRNAALNQIKKLPVKGEVCN